MSVILMTTIQIYCTAAVMDLCALRRITSPSMTGYTVTNSIATALVENPAITSVELSQQASTHTALSDFKANIPLAF